MCTWSNIWNSTFIFHKALAIYKCQILWEGKMHFPQQRPIITQTENNVKYVVLDYSDHGWQPTEYVSVQFLRNVWHHITHSELAPKERRNRFTENFKLYIREWTCMYLSAFESRTSILMTSPSSPELRNTCGVSCCMANLWAGPRCWPKRRVERQVPVEDNSARRICPSRPQDTIWVSPVNGRNLAWKNLMHSYLCLVFCTAI